MPSDLEKRLVRIAQLKAIALQRFRDKKIEANEYQQINSRLDNLSFEQVRGGLSDSLDDLIEAFENDDLEVNLAPFRKWRRQEGFESIGRLRQQALADQRAFLDLSSIDPALQRIPLQEFDWQEALSGLARLAQAVDSPDCALEEVRQAGRDFFDRSGIQLSGLVPDLKDSLVKRLVAEGHLPHSDTLVFSQGLEQMRLARNQILQDLNRSFFAGQIDMGRFNRSGPVAFELLQDQLQSDLNLHNPDLNLLVIQWQGPFFAKLAQQWLKVVRPNRECEILVFARTGIDPGKDPQKWGSWTLQARGQDRLGQGAFKLKAARLGPVYELAFVLSRDDLPQQQVQAHWWPLLQRILGERTRKRQQAAAQAAEAAQPKPDKARVAEAARPEPDKAQVAEAARPEPDKAQAAEAARSKLDKARAADAARPEPEPRAAEAEPGPAETVAAAGPSPQKAEEPPEPFAAQVEDEAEFLHAAPAQASIEDLLVEQHSTWNVYFKPFLSENWLGLIGVFSLMAAWLFLSMWLWDQGPAFRQLAGVLPLAGFTLGAAFVTSFIHRLESRGASSKAVSLFGLLCFLSIPFNFALGASIASEDSLALGAGLAALYSLGLPLISRRIQAPFGHDPKAFLLLSNLALYLPPLALRASVQPQHGLHAALFVSFLVLVGSLQRASRAAPSGFDFSKGVFSIHFLLANGISFLFFFLFFRTLPDIGMLAILLQMAAWSLSYFGKGSPAALSAMGTSLLGILLCLNSPDHLPFCLALAVGFWLFQRHKISEPWPNEIVVFHLLGLAASLAYLADLPLGLSAWVAVPVIAAAALLEKSGSSEIRSLTWGLPLYMGAALGLAWSQPETGLEWTAPLLVALAGLYLYRRTLRWYRRHLWLLNLALTPTLFYLCWPGGLDPAPYLSGLALVWLLLSTFLKDSFALQHRTTVLWVFAFASALAFGAGLKLGPMSAGLMFSGIASLVALFAAARRASSSLPVYLALLVAGLLGYWLKNELKIVSESGLTSGLGAAALLGLAALLRRYRVWQEGGPPAKFFGSDFALRSELFLAAPMEKTAALLAGLSLLTGLSFLAPLTENSKLGLALLLNLALWTRFGALWLRPLIGWIVMVPGAAFGAALVMSFGWDWRLLAAGGCLLFFLLLRDRLRLVDRPLCRLFLEPFDQMAQALAFLSVPAGFGAYAYLAQAPPLPFILLGLLALAIAHRYLVLRVSTIWNHAVILHLVVLWGWIFWLLQGGPPALPSGEVPVAFILQSLAGAAMLLFLPAYFLEVTQRETWQAYARSAHHWLGTLSFLFAILLMFPMEGRSLLPLPLPYFVAGYILVHLGNRSWQSPIMTFLKGLLCTRLALVWTHDFLSGLFMAIVLFTLLELLLGRAGSVSRLRLPASPFAEEPSTLGKQAAWVLTTLVTVFILAHLVLILTGQQMNDIPSYLLYGLIPYCFFLKKRLGFGFLGDLGLALFPYANAFIFLRFLPEAQSWGLTPLHLTSASFLFSIVSFLIVLTFLRGKSQRV